MDRAIFDFSRLTIENIETWERKSNIFNMTKDGISKEKVILSSFYDERLGESVERLDVAVSKDGKWEILDIDDKIEGYNEIPLGYVLENVSYDKVMVILRRLSSMIIDKEKSGVSTFIYYKVDDKYRDVVDNKTLLGKLASNKICLDDSDEMFDKLRKIGILEDINRLISI